MAARPERHSLVAAARHAVEELAGSVPTVRVVDAEEESDRTERTLRGALGDRYSSVPTTAAGPLADSIGGVAADGPTFLFGRVTDLIGPSYPALRSIGTAPAPPVKLLASHAGLASAAADERPAVCEDLGVVRGIPGLTVVVPADAPSAAAAVRTVARTDGPAYVRLTRERLPTVGSGDFRLAHAAILRDGNDLAVVALGATVAPALGLADELARVGVAARVLDLASVKPFDEPALVRAARETGAILVVEEHSVTTGVGALVASVTAERHPVPVRRVGIPDVGLRGGSEAATFLWSPERLAEEAFELLRLRGKVE